MKPGHISRNQHSHNSGRPGHYQQPQRIRSEPARIIPSAKQQKAVTLTDKQISAIMLTCLVMASRASVSNPHRQ